jgi:hypothetical protein
VPIVGEPNEPATRGQVSRSDTIFQRKKKMQDNDNLNDQSIITPALSVIEQQERASIDMLISTAKKYPRDLTRVKRSMEAMATLDTETAEGCNYTLKRKDKNGAEILIQGPSVRMAEIAVASYSNIRAGSRVVSNDGKIITGQAFCHDLENNTFIAWETQRRITDKSGRTYGEDLQVLTGNAASAIAFRNAVFKVIPRALIDPVADKALRVAVGDIKTLEERRQRALKKFATLGVDVARILSFLGKKTIAEIDIVDVENLFGIFTAIREGSVSIEEQFPKEGKVVEPNLPGKESPAAQGQAAAPAQALIDAARQMKGEPEKADPAKVVAFPQNADIPRRPRGRPRKEEAPAAATASPGAPVAEPEPKPAAPSADPPKGPQAPPAPQPSQSDPVKLTALHIKLMQRIDDESLSREGFLLRMFDFKCVGTATQNDIKAGRYTLANLAEDDVDLALNNWNQVTGPLEKLGP